MQRIVGGHSTTPVHGDFEYHLKHPYSLGHDKNFDLALSHNWCLELRQLFADKFNYSVHIGKTWLFTRSTKTGIMVEVFNFPTWIKLYELGKSNEELIDYFCEYLRYKFPNLIGITLVFVFDHHKETKNKREVIL